MRTAKEILDEVNRRHDSLVNRLKALKTSKNPDNTKVQLTQAYLDEIQTESERRILEELRDFITET